MTETKVVIIDDEMPARNLLRQYLQNFSFFNVIAECKNGIEAVGVINALHPDLIFLDIQMPGKTGFEVLQEIKQSDRTRHLPIIIFSTTNDEKAINTTRELGANLYIPKPSSFSSLKKAIKHSLSINWDTFTPSTEDFVYRA